MKKMKFTLLGLIASISLFAIDTIRVKPVDTIPLIHNIGSGNVTWYWGGSVIPAGDIVRADGTQYFKLNTGYHNAHLRYSYDTPARFDTVAYYHIWKAPVITSINRPATFINRDNQGSAYSYKVGLADTMNLDNVYLWVSDTPRPNPTNDSIIYVGKDLTFDYVHGLSKVNIGNDIYRTYSYVIVSNPVGADTILAAYQYIYKSLSLDSIAFKSELSGEVLSKGMRGSELFNLQAIDKSDIWMFVYASGNTTSGRTKSYTWVKDGLPLFNSFNQPSWSTCSFGDNLLGTYQCWIKDNNDSIKIATFVLDKSSIVLSNGNFGDVAVFVYNKVLTVKTSSPVSVEVYSVLGQKIYGGFIDGVNLPLASGYYIVIVGGKSYKVKV